MTRTVHKYIMPAPGGMVQRSIAWPAKIVHVGMQGDYPQMWVEVPQTAVAYATVEIWTVGTGWDIPIDTEHVGSVIDDEFVWHFYARWVK